MSGTVGAAYDRRAQEYVEKLGRVDALAVRDRLAIEAWADRVEGPILDAGCGPGHWTDHLAARREDPVVGLDASVGFLASARVRFPGVAFVEGDLADLPFEDASFGGVLSWFSIIHTPPPEVVPVLNEFRRVLRRGGSILLGFVTGDDGVPFDHAVTTAYFRRAETVADLLTRAGFVVAHVGERKEHGMRAQGEVVARA